MTSKQYRKIEREYNRIGLILTILAMGWIATGAAVLLTR